MCAYRSIAFKTEIAKENLSILETNSYLLQRVINTLKENDEVFIDDLEPLIEIEKFFIGIFEKHLKGFNSAFPKNIECGNLISIASNGHEILCTLPKNHLGDHGFKAESY